MIGAMTALITPFKNGKVDFKTYEELIIRQCENGIDYVVPVGTTGESATLSHNEHKECIEIAVNVCKNRDTKVLAGAGSNATSEAIDLAKFAEKCGADAILSVSPYYNKPSQTGIYEHYKAIANSVNIDVVLYNVPSRTNSDISADTAIKLYDDCKNIIAVKEASGNVSKIVEYQSKSDIILISGDDAINYPILASGGKGIISVTSNLLPKKLSELVHTALDGNLAESKKINEELFEINRVLFIEANPIMIKYAMFEAGLIPTLEYRLPLTPPNEKSKETISKILNKYL